MFPFFIHEVVTALFPVTTLPELEFAIFPLLALLPAAFQLGQGIYQNAEANKLKESTYIPPQLRMKRELAQQQAFSRRAPGAALAEEQNRRNLATSLSAARRNFGGDVNKIAAISSAAGAQAQDANARIAAQGQQFSENAFARIGQADSEIAGVQERNRRQYEQTKAELYRASGQNLFGGISNVATFGLAGGFGGIDKGIKAGANEKIKAGKLLKQSADTVDTPGYFDEETQAVVPGAKGVPKGTNKMTGQKMIREGRAIKKAARQEKWKTAGSNMLQAQNPMLGGEDWYGSPEYNSWMARTYKK